MYLSAAKLLDKLCNITCAEAENHLEEKWAEAENHLGDVSVRATPGKAPANMANLSEHAKARSADRSIKSVYVDECMRKGKRTNEDDTRYKYCYEGLCVIAEPRVAITQRPS